MFKVHDNQNRDSELKVLVHQSHAGAVIGRGGSRIKELREENGVDLKVIPSNIYKSNKFFYIIILNFNFVMFSRCIQNVVPSRQNELSRLVENQKKLWLA